MDTTIYGIVYGCPFGKRNPDCLLYEVDHLSYREKYKWINGLIEEKKKAIVKHHKLCINKRENKYKF